MGRTANYSKQDCSVAATLEVVGEPWTLLILRDAFFGVNRFEQWRSHLGIARNVLAYRLKALVADGLLERRAYSEKPLRYEYILTEKGRDIYPVLMMLRNWGDRHVFGAGAEPLAYIHTDCGHPTTPAVVCEHCHNAVTGDNVQRVRPANREAPIRAATYASVVAQMKPPPRTRAGSAGS